MTNDVAKQEAGGVPAVAGYGDYAGAGFEGTTSADYSLPFIYLLQGLSPQCETVEAAKPGKFIDTVSNDVFDGKTGFAFIPVVRERVYSEWRPRASGGGYQGRHLPESELVQKAIKAATEFGKFKLPNGNDLVETFYVFGLVVTEDTTYPAVMAFKSTAIKKYKNWMSRAQKIMIDVGQGQKIVAPLFAHRYRITSVEQSNPKGKFYNFDVNFDGPDAKSCRLLPTDQLFQAAVKLREQVLAGQAKADEGVTGVKNDGDDDIPF